MRTLALCYITDTMGRLTDGAGACHNVRSDRLFFKNLIEGKSVLVGGKTWRRDWRGFRPADKITVLSRSMKNEFSRDNLRDSSAVRQCRAGIASALAQAVAFTKPDAEIICAGGRKALELFAPFASRAIVSEIADGKCEAKLWPFYLPSHIALEITEDCQVWESVLEAQNEWNNDNAAVRTKCRTRFDIRRRRPIAL